MQAGRYPVVGHTTIEGLEFRLIGPLAPLPEAEGLSGMDLAVHPDEWDRVRQAVGFEPPVGRLHGCPICGGQWLGEGLTTVYPYLVDRRSDKVYCISACSPACVERAAELTREALRRSLKGEDRLAREQENSPSVTSRNKS
jgi:hypothetical protein